MRPIYVRTNKRELGLPPVDRVLAPLAMAPVQAELYKLMKYEVAREAASALSARTRMTFRSLGRSVAKLLQFVSIRRFSLMTLRLPNRTCCARFLPRATVPKSVTF